MIHSFKYCSKKFKDLGKIEQIKGSLVTVSGFEGACIGEAVTFENGEHGEVFTIKENLVEVLVFSRNQIRPDEKIARSGEALSISAGEGLLGHAINSLGYTLDDKREDSIIEKLLPIEVKPVGITDRKRVNKFLETGVTVVDLVVPLGMGQRELIIGDRKTGKTSFLLQTVLSQTQKEVICIYCLIGKRRSEAKEIYSFLKEKKVMDYCIIVSASADESPGEVYVAPFTAMTLAEYFKDQGKDVLLILDDLTTHAKYYREISLTAGRFPGRESYPGDIFYIHSKLLERAGNFEKASITCLPVAEAPAGDITGYIQTNLMGITDGHIYFDSDLFFKGIRPAVNVFLSVTRVGKQTQIAEIRNVGKDLLILMKQVEEMARYLRFGSEVTPQVQAILEKGEKLTDLFNQRPDDLLSINESYQKAKTILEGK